ncbi:MAG: tripartite tricarboxylate transporter TctB family protein [Gammaproteobacteria bacterium]
MQRKPSPRADLGLGAFLIAVCAAVLYESRAIPPGTFEPLGSAPVPQTVASLIIVLSLAVMVRAWRSLRAGQSDGRPDVVPRWADAALAAALTVVYALTLEFRIGRFDVLTTLYLFATIGLLVRFRRRSLPAVALVAAVVGFGCQLLFTRVFVVDLPGAF